MSKTQFGPLFSVFLIVAVDVLAFTLILPLLPFYAQDFGATPFQVGVLASSFAIAQLISGPWLGRLSDRVGRKPVLMLSQTGTLVGFLLLAFAPNLIWVFISRIIDGITAGNLTIAQAVIADITPKEKRTKAFGVIGIAFGLGFLIGPAMSAFLVTYHKTAPALTAALLSFISILCTAKFLPKTEIQPDSTRDLKSVARLRGAFNNENLRQRLIQFLIFGFIFAGFTSGFALFVERSYTLNGVKFGPREVGWLFAYSGFLGLIVQGFLLGRLVQKFGENKLVAVGFISMALGYIGLGLTDFHWVLLISVTIGSFGSGLLRPALTALVSQAVGPQEQGATLGVTQTLTGMGQIFAPLISGYLINQSGASSAWLFAWCFWLGLLALFGLAVQLFYRRASA